MTLADLRKLSIRRQIRVRFPIREGMECVVNEHGVAQVPGLRSTTDLNLEQELASAGSFTLEPAAPTERSRQVLRPELEQLVTTAPPTAAEEHEEE